MTHSKPQRKEPASSKKSKPDLRFLPVMPHHWLSPPPRSFEGIKPIYDLPLYLLPTLFFLILKAYSAAPVAGDENIYFYAGSRLLEGVAPYRELFFAHPPLHLLIAALWMSPGMISPYWLKIASILPATGTLLLVIFLLRRSGLSRPVVFLASLFLVGSQDYLSVSSHFTGANWSAFFMVLGLALFLLGRLTGTGVALALSAGVAFHVAPALLGLLLVGYIIEGKHGRSILVAFFLTTFVIHLFFGLLFGEPYLRQVFGYHLMKTPMSSGGSTSTLRFFHTEHLLAAWALLGAAFSLVRMIAARRAHVLPPPPSALNTMTLGAVALQLAGVFSSERVFTYYLSPLLPLFAILSATALSELFALLRRLRLPEGRIRAGLLLLFIGLFLGAAFAGGEALERTMGYYQREKGKVVTYTWRDSRLLPAWIDRGVETLFFRTERTIGAVDSRITRYLWHEINSEDPTPMVFELLSRGLAEGTLFGDASTVPYLALATGRKVALDQADTNAQIFKSGLIPISDFLVRLSEKPPVFVVINPKIGIGTNPEFKRWLLRSYLERATTPLGEDETLVLYELTPRER